MKNMFIERFRFFEKLSFGAKWNLRDIMRHKSRSAMSLLGVVGCMIIIVAALGMSDTMSAFLATYYDDATKYASRIYLADGASDEQIEKILEKYDGDWSASVSVQLDDAPVSLDVYDTDHGFVSFPENGKGFVELGDGGAYICSRIANENSLKPGDSFMVSPYGYAESYELKVAGVIRSVSKNIVITPAYAETLGISYRIDSVYTITDKADIAQESSIKSVQSKQMIVDSFDMFTELMDMMVIILILGAALLGIVVLYNLGVMSYTERYREMATLKVVGFMDRRISGLLIWQNMWITALGAIIGLPAGIGVLNYMINELASEYEMRLACGPKTYILSVVLTFGVSFLVSLLVSGKNKHIDMVEPFKEAE